MRDRRSSGLRPLPLLLALALSGCGGEAPEPPAIDGDDGTVRAPQSDPAPAPSGRGPSAPEASDPEASPADASETLDADAPEGWVLYRHARGTAMFHPPDWRVRETQAGLLVVPPDHDEEREVILGTASDADGLTDPLGLRARRRIDRTIARTVPGLEREGRGRRLDTREGAGAAYDYVGRAPDGTEVRARVFATISDGALGGLSIVADVERFEARVDVVETMFTTIHRAETAPAAGPAGRGDGAASGPIDPRLVGAFQGEAIASGSGVYVNAQLLYALNADGTILYGARSHMNASKRDADGGLRWTAGGVSDGSVRTGRWTAEDGVLTIRWDGGGRSAFAYGFEPDGTLALRHPVTRKLIDIYSPVR